MDNGLICHEYCWLYFIDLFLFLSAFKHYAVGSASNSRVRGPEFDTRSGHILSFLLPPVASYWQKYVHEVLFNTLSSQSLPRKSVVRLSDRPDMTLAVYRGRKT